MGALSAKKAILKLDISGVKVPVGEVRSFSLETSLGTIDVSNIGTDWKEFLVGQAGWTASMELFYDPTDTAQDALVDRTVAGTPCQFVILPFGEDEVYDLDLGGASGGTFTLGDGDAKVTSALAYNATAAQIQTALNTAYEEDGIIVAGTVITFPAGVTAELTLDATSLSGATNPAVTLRDEIAEFVGTGVITSKSLSGATEDAIGMSVSVQGNGELELNPA
jgi:hypothetical protein